MNTKAGREKTLVPLNQAQKRGTSFDWEKQDIAVPFPDRLGTHLLDVELKEVLAFFDWSPFFWSWELKGKYPEIFNRKNVGEEAQKLYDQAQALLKKIIEEDLFRCQAVIGLWPAHAVGDDVEVFDDLKKTKHLGTFHFIRRQQSIPNHPHYCLSDFVAPKESGRIDYLGAFAVSAGSGVETLALEYERDNDDYNSIMVKALGDRFAEAMAEYSHKITREWWTYGMSENLSNEALIDEEYRGIRPASGYPSQPDHTEKDLIWKLLSVEERIGLKLTESRAMYPGCSVSGLYFSHPQAKYFNVGSLGRDQVENYAERKGWTWEESLKWLRPNLGFDA